MKRFICPAVVFFLILFASCQKELTYDLGHRQAGAGNDSTLLSMYVQVDTTKTAPLDTLYKTIFTYDNLERNTVIELIVYENGVPGNSRYITTFTYSGTDTVPAKKVLISPLLQNTDPGYLNTTSFFFYSNGNLSGDSSLIFGDSYSSLITNQYTYTASGIINVYGSYDITRTNGYTETDTLSIQRSNGNIISQNAVKFTGGVVEKFSYKYDNHPNPFFQTQNKFAIDNRYPLYRMETFVEEVFAKNNALEVDQWDNAYHYHFLHDYEYNALGYPTVVRFYNQNDRTDFGKGLYFYSK